MAAAFYCSKINRTGSTTEPEPDILPEESTIELRRGNDVDDARKVFSRRCREVPYGPELPEMLPLPFVGAVAGNEDIEEYVAVVATAKRGPLAALMSSVPARVLAPSAVNTTREDSLVKGIRTHRRTHIPALDRTIGKRPCGLWLSEPRRSRSAAGTIRCD